MRSFYVYAHIDPFTSKPFYIGKGTGNRMYSAKRNPMWQSFVNDYLAGQGMTFETKILHVCKSEKEALDKEAEEIVNAVKNGFTLLNKTVPHQRVQPEVLLETLKSGDGLPDSAESISAFVRRKRKENKLNQQEFANRAGVGLRFLRELENGKLTLRTDKVNQVLSMFGSCLVPFQRTI